MNIISDGLGHIRNAYGIGEISKQNKSDFYIYYSQMRLFTYRNPKVSDDNWYCSILIKENDLDDAYYYFINNVADQCYIVSIISWYIE